MAILRRSRDSEGRCFILDRAFGYFKIYKRDKGVCRFRFELRTAVALQLAVEGVKFYMKIGCRCRFVSCRIHQLLDAAWEYLNVSAVVSIEQGVPNGH